MATLAELQDALVNADKAGDVEAARALADAISSMSPEPAAKPADPKADYDALPTWQKPLVAVDDIVRKIANGATFGFADKLAAKGDQAVGGGNYDELLKRQRQLSSDASERAGSAGTVAEFGGNVAGAAALTGGGAMSLVPQAASTPMRLLAAGGLGATEGAGYGALDALGHDTDVKEGAKMGAITGGIAGPLVEGASTLANNWFRRNHGVNRTPPIDDLRTAKDDAYRAVEDVGATYPPDRYRRMVQDLNTDLVRPHGGVREVRHPHAYDTLQQFTDTAANSQRGPTLYDLDLDRQGIFNDMIIPGGNESSFGRRMADSIDRFVGDTTGVRTNTGTPQEAVDQLLSARDLNTRFRKAEEVGSTITKAGRNAAAKGTGATSGNELRAGFKSILNNDTRAAGYSPEETGLMEQIIAGTRGGNIARSAASKMDGYTGKALAAGAGTGLGALASGGNPVVSGMGGLAGVGASGMIAGGLRGIAERSTRNLADDLLHLTTTGRRFETGKSNALVGRGSESELERLLMLLGISGDQGDSRTRKPASN